jgi:hypothetical protein
VDGGRRVPVAGHQGIDGRLRSSRAVRSVPGPSRACRRAFCRREDLDPGPRTNAAAAAVAQRARAPTHARLQEARRRGSLRGARGRYGQGHAPGQRVAHGNRFPRLHEQGRAGVPVAGAARHPRQLVFPCDARGQGVAGRAPPRAVSLHADQRRASHSNGGRSRKVRTMPQLGHQNPALKTVCTKGNSPTPKLKALPRLDTSRLRARSCGRLATA